MNMKNFLIKIFVFTAIMGVVFVGVLFLPTTPKSRNFVLFSKIEKDSLLKNVAKPRIIFIGGSNLVYGLNGQIIKDSLDLNPINTGSIATVGLSFMMDNTLPYIRSGDIVVVAPEYQQFFGTFAYGNQGLLRLLMDVDPKGFEYIKMEQWLKIGKNLPDYFVSKLDPEEYFNVHVDPAYRSDIFNEFGDSNAHWVLKKQGFDPYDFVKRKLNKSILKEMKKFEQKVIDRGAFIYVTYPCFQDTSFEINKSQISMVESALNDYEFKILGTAERYKMPDSLMFDTPYHLIKEGVDLRTNYLIEDLKKKKELNLY